MGASDSEVLLKVLIHKNEERVVLAEANSAFVDILFSFLTLPMGTLVRVLAKNSEPSLPMAIGSFNSLYKSIEYLDNKYFATEACKDLLLNARNSAEEECQKLKINIDGMKPYFICEGFCFSVDRKYASFSTSSTTKCQRCGKFMIAPVYMCASTNEGDKGVFVTDSASFVIQDDLKVIPSNLARTLDILKSSGITDFGVLEERILKIGSSEILYLVEKALLSKTCLTDLVFGEKCTISPVPSTQSKSSTDSVDGFQKITVNVLVQKSNNKILLAHSSEDFIHMLFSFLSVPLGRVIGVLSKNDGPALCVKNLHQSVSELTAGEYLISQQMKDKLINPHLAMIYQCSNQLFPLNEELIPKFYCATKILSPGRKTYYLSTVAAGVNRELKLASPMCEGRFLKGSTKFMVTDALVVTPLSSMSCISYLQRWKVSLCDIEEHVIDIGLEEALNLLRESLISTSVLTNGLKHLIWNKTNAERSPKKPKVAGSYEKACWMFRIVWDIKLLCLPPVATVFLVIGNNLPFSFGGDTTVKED
ncbi:hypothetical protein POM88_008161 [Heracleum sosnowskyi]|uniref:DUF674 family protein n=1 Tax=Heracleum sosnowskyi TaxID=360622 RepID=A0AAD8N884_9APIA|nr:hypothetical protein POM88_008161 [Heracleum sosnowskyi]